MNVVGKCVAPLMSVLMQLSLLKTALFIQKEGCTFQFSQFPFISLYTNSAVWAVYACLRRDLYVFFPNLIGFLIGVFSTYIFMTNDNSKSYQFPTASQIASFLFLTLTLIFGVLNQALYIGVMGNLLAIVLLGSPLATLKTVLESKSTTSMPFSTSFLSLTTALAWVLYGALVVNDPLIYAPNCCGCVLSLIQLFIFYIYGVSNIEGGSEREELHVINGDYYKYVPYCYNSADRADDEVVSEQNENEYSSLPKVKGVVYQLVMKAEAEED